MTTWARRDLTIISGVGDDCFVVACDSCGAVGEKQGDELKLPARLVAKLTARVALSEVICSGAKPIMIINGVANEMKPTGVQFIAGIREELANASIFDIALNGSTEENFATNMTALAITVIGACKESELKFGRAEKGDKFILLGEPKVGNEVDLEGVGLYDEIRQLLRLPQVREIVPVGSNGVAHEAKTLASLNGMAIEFRETKICYKKSAGPATCFVVLCAQSALEQVLNIYSKGLIIGEIM